jgi:hypothetical protein
MRGIADIGLPPIIFHYRNQKRALAAFAFDVRFTPKADIHHGNRNVRFGPAGDIQSAFKPKARCRNSFRGPRFLLKLVKIGPDLDGVVG